MIAHAPSPGLQETRPLTHLPPDGEIETRLAPAQPVITAPVMLQPAPARSIVSGAVPDAAVTSTPSFDQDAAPPAPRSTQRLQRDHIYHDPAFPRLSLITRADGSVGKTTLKILMAAAALQARCSSDNCDCYALAGLLIEVRRR